MKIQGSLFFWIPVIIFILYQIGINITEQALFVLFTVITVFISAYHLVAIIYFFVEKCWEYEVDNTYGPEFIKYSYKYSAIHLLVLLTKFLNNHLTINLKR